MKRLRSSLVVLATVTVLAAGCGTSTPYSASPASTGSGPKVVVGKRAARLIVASAAASAAAKSARIDGSATIDIAGLPKPLSFSMQGLTTFDGREGDLKMDMSSILGMIPGAPSKLVIEARVVDGVMYMSFGDVMEAVAGGRALLPPRLRGIKWLSLDLTSIKGANGLGSSPSSFTQTLEYLRAATDNGVRTIGQERVRGVATTHYSARITKAQLEASLRKNAGSSPLGKEALAGIAMFRDGLTIDVWIDGDQLVRRETIDVPMNMLGQTGSMNMSIDFYDYGTPVDVQAPPVSEVRPFTDLARISAGA